MRGLGWRSEDVALLGQESFGGIPFLVGMLRLASFLVSAFFAFGMECNPGIGQGTVKVKEEANTETEGIWFLGLTWSVARRMGWRHGVFVSLSFLWGIATERLFLFLVLCD